MAYELFWALGATLIVSLIALIGIISLYIKEKVINEILLVLIAFSAGALMGGAFMHLIPEALEEISSGPLFFSVLVGFLLFFMIERFLKWHHCHKGKCEIHTLGHMNLVGDAIHNFIDGVIIATSFVVSIPLGIFTTIAIISHEVPQEIGDFAVLIYSGFSKAKALFFNFMTALTAVVGAIFGFFLTSYMETIIPYILPFAAGGFIYIAASDLVPELHKEPELKKAIYSILFFVIGLLFMWGIKLVFEH